MSTDPLVSIVIPVFNGALYLGEAIDSALAQSYPNVEVLVINDGSRDGGATERVALSYGDRVRYFRKANGGAATALNLGIEEMRGEYFSWLSHDDMYEPEKIEKQVSALVPYAGQAFAYCDFRLVSKDGAPIATCRVAPQSRLLLRPLLAIGGGAGLHGCGLLMPRAFFDIYGRFDPSRPCTQDNELWFRFADKAPAVHVAEVLVIGRVHDAQTGITQTVKCTRESDLLHASQIAELSEAEIDAHVNHSVETLVRTYSHHKRCGYPRKSLQLLRHLCRLARKNGETESALRVVNEAIVREDNPEAVRRLWDDHFLPLASSPKTRARVLVYTNVWFRGGTERGITTLLNALNGRYEWILVSSDLEREGGFALAGGIRHIRLRDTEPPLLASRLASLGAILDVDLFIGFPNIVADLLDVYELFDGIGIRTIAANRADYFLPYRHRRLAPLITRRNQAFRRAHAVVWQTAFTSNLYSHLADNGAHLPNPNPNPIATVLPVAATSEKVVLAVGRFYDPIKRLDRVLEVFARVLVLHPDARLVVVGGCDAAEPLPGVPGQVRELLARLRLDAARLRFVGETEDVDAFYRGASVMILTSDSEGFPNVLLEAGAHGLPVVYFDIPGIEDVITDGENGFMVGQDDLEAMAARVCELLGDRERRESMGRRAQELVKRFDQKGLCERWGELIDLVLAVRNQKRLNRELEDRFRPALDGPKAFTTRVLAEYERNLPFLIGQFTEAPSGKTVAFSRAHRLLTSLEREGLAPTLRKIIRKVGKKVRK